MAFAQPAEPEILDQKAPVSQQTRSAKKRHGPFLMTIVLVSAPFAALGGVAATTRMVRRTIST